MNHEGSTSYTRFPYMFDWPLHRDFSLLFARSEVGSFTCIGYFSPIHGTDGLESPPKDLAMRIKRLAKGRYCRAGIWTRNLQYGSSRSSTHSALRPLGYDSSSIQSFHCIVKEHVKKLLESLSEGISPGTDNLDGKLLKIAAEHIASPICHIFSPAQAYFGSMNIST